jgi:hypothetical protein
MKAAFATGRRQHRYMCTDTVEVPFKNSIIIRRRWEDNFKMYRRKAHCEVDRTGSEWYPIWGFGTSGVELPNVNNREFVS